MTGNQRSEIIGELVHDNNPPVRIIALEMAAFIPERLSEEQIQEIGLKLNHNKAWQEQCAAALALGCIQDITLKITVAEWLMHHYVNTSNEYVEVATIYALDQLKLDFTRFNWSRGNALKQYDWKKIIEDNRKMYETRISNLNRLIRLREDDLIGL